MDGKKAVGWFLVLGGVSLIAWTLFSSWQIFSGEKGAPQIFQSSQAAPKRQVPGGTQNLQAPAQELVAETLREQLKEFFPADSTPKLLNLISWSILATIFLFGGGQIGGIGANLLR